MAKWIHTSSGIAVPVQDAGGYRLIYADPAWSYGDSGTRGGVANQYKTLTLEELCALDVGGLAAPDAALFMWATWPTLPDALQVITAWGFTYKTCAFTWVKINKKANTPFFGNGHWSRANTEPCLLAVRGDIRRVSASVAQVIVDERDDDTLFARIGRHSAKPPEARARVLKLMGDTEAKVELFAREHTPGWDVWGNDPAITSDLERAA